MYRNRRSQTRLSYAASVSWNQIKVILGLYWKVCLVGATAFAIITMVLAFCEPPSYRSTAFLKIRTFDIAKTISNSALKDSDDSTTKDLIAYQTNLINSKDFAPSLLAIVHEDQSRKNLSLAWGIGKRFRLSLFLSRLGLIMRKNPKVDLDALDGDELLALFSSMSEIRVDNADNSIQVQVTALDAQTAKKVAGYLADTFIVTSTKAEVKELEKSILFLQGQRESMRKRLIDAEEAMKQFYKENPMFASDSSRRSVAEEANSLNEEYSKKVQELKANQRLLEFYKKKMNSFLASVDTTTEVYNKFKEELIELKYKRKKYIFQGYSETHEGIKEIDEKVANLERVLASAGDFSRKNVVSVGHESKLSDKVVELQDLIKKDEIDLESLKKRQIDAEARSKILPEQEMLHADFQREVRLCRELLEDILKRLEMAEIRRASAKGILGLMPNSGAAVFVRSLPAASRIIFAFLVGFLVTAAACTFITVLRKIVIDELNVLDMGFKYAGDLKPRNSNRAKVLLNLGAQYKEYAEDNTIVLCSSPRGEFGISQVLMLTEYLSKQKEKSLFIVVGKMDIGEHFQLKTDLKYAQVYSSDDGRQFILQIFDEETLYSIRECLAIIENQYKVKYSMVFLYIQEGIECPIYAYGQQLADKMLLIGDSGKYSSTEYFNLVQGFKNFEQIYVALTESKKGKTGSSFFNRNKDSFNHSRPVA